MSLSIEGRHHNGMHPTPRHEVLCTFIVGAGEAGRYAACLNGKLNMNQYRSILLALITCALIFVPACNMFEWQYEEIERFTSPDGMVDAVWVRGDGGATTGFVYDLYIVPTGLKFEKDATSFKHAVFSGDHVEELRIVWREPKLLEIQFKHARIFGYRNYWQYWNPDSPEAYRPYVVETRLVHTIEGSMLTERDRP